MSERVAFYSWIRQGWAGVGLPADTPGASLAARVRRRIEVRLSDGGAPGAMATLLGPQDVAGIDPREVIRMEPAPHSRGFEPNVFACIEFDRPDLPWLFTPASASPDDRLRPWLCLIVVPKRDGVALLSGTDRPIPVLTIGTPANPRELLPDLAGSWAWAHAQVAAFDGPLDAELAAHPERWLSRLLCPARLRPNTDYYACVVPAFAAGRRAGLSEPLTEADLSSLAPAWDVNDAALTSINLPVYHYWEFSTGAGGDFASLAKLLTPRRLGADIGMAPLDVSSAHDALPSLEDGSPNRVLGLEGALLSVSAERRGLSGPEGDAFRSALTRLLLPPSDEGDDPIVGPPVYADHHAGTPAISNDDVPRWLRELNLDPRYRVVAALGTRIVQEHQEEILASIWRQTGDITRANALLRNAQLAKTVNTKVVRRRLGALQPDMLLQMTRPIQGRLPAAVGTLRQAVDAHFTSTSLTIPQFRRVARPRGPAVRAVLPPRSRTVLSTWRKVATGILNPIVARPDGGIVTLERVEQQFRAEGGFRPPGQVLSFHLLATIDVAALPKRPAFEVRTPDPFFPPGSESPPLDPPGNTDSFSAARLRAAFIAHQPRLAVPPILLTGPPVSLVLDQLRQEALAGLEPARRMRERLDRVIGGRSAPENNDPFDPVLATPELERPMYEALRDLFPSLMLPGLGQIVDNTVGLLVTNAPFVEALLAGLNHELGRELLWRGFPAKSRTTYFRRFWDRRGAPGTQTLTADVPPIDEWSRTAALGTIAEGGEGQIVILVRGELTRRYSNAIYYMVEAAPASAGTKPRPGTRERHPSFRGRLGTDVLFFGFALTEDEAKGVNGPGWFVVIQQAPGEPRFGVPADDPSTSPFHSPDVTAAATARRYYQRPVRVAMHASTLLP